jgi:hypothetical protein
MEPSERRWAASDSDYRLIWLHLERQRDVSVGFVRLDDDRIVRVGEDAEGEDVDE